MPKASKADFFFKFDWLPANLAVLVSAAIIVTMIVVALQVNQQAHVSGTKSLAWYMANPQAALEDNKICYDNPQLKSSENCINSLHALEVMHKGPNS